jgi:snRNA-activating protein complex subunit 3
MCRGCMRVPAVVAVSGDLRLGESPCVLCGPCWRSMGIPNEVPEGERIVLAPLPKHQVGW